MCLNNVSTNRALRISNVPAPNILRLPALPPLQRGRRHRTRTGQYPLHVRAKQVPFATFLHGPVGLRTGGALAADTTAAAGQQRRHPQRILNASVSTYQRQLPARQSGLDRGAQSAGRVLAVLPVVARRTRLLSRLTGGRQLVVAHHVQHQLRGANLAEHGQHIEGGPANAARPIGGAADGARRAGPNVEVGAGKGHQGEQHLAQGVLREACTAAAKEFDAEQPMHDGRRQQALHQRLGDAIGAGAALPAQAGHQLLHGGRMLQVLDGQPADQGGEDALLGGHDGGVPLGGEQHAQKAGHRLMVGRLEQVERRRCGGGGGGGIGIVGGRSVVGESGWRCWVEEGRLDGGDGVGAETPVLVVWMCGDEIDNFVCMSCTLLFVLLYYILYMYLSQ